MSKQNEFVWVLQGDPRQREEADGQPVELAEMAEENPEQLLAWPLPLLELYEVEEIVISDLFSYPVVANELEFKRQVSHSHALRWMMLTVKDCETTLGETWQDIIDEVRRIIRSLPENKPHLLHILWKRVVSLEGLCTSEALAVAKLCLGDFFLLYPPLI